MFSGASRPSPAELLAAFAEAMRRGGWRWYVFGAQAVVAYGRPRMTADVDVTVDLGEQSALDLVSVLRDGGFELRIELSEEFLRDAHLVPGIHCAPRMPPAAGGSARRRRFLR